MKKIVFILDHKLNHYRIPLFRKLAEKYSVTVIHKGPELYLEEDFKEVVVRYIRLGPFILHKMPRDMECDVLIVMQNVRMLSYYTMTFKYYNKAKVVHWGIGVSSGKGLQKKRNMQSIIRNVMSSFVSHIAFYSSYPLNFYSKNNINKSTVVGNTIHNALKVNYASEEKDSFLFIGTFEARKKINHLLAAFKMYLQDKDDKKIKTLILIGDGPQKDDVNKLVDDLNLSKNVVLTGKIENDSKKGQFFKRSVATLSPAQAGLSVAESFSYGVPFVTSFDAITGGERFYVTDFETGLLFDGTVEGLVQKLKVLNNDPELATKMGNSAYNFYEEHLTIEAVSEKFSRLFES